MGRLVILILALMLIFSPALAQPPFLGNEADALSVSTPKAGESCTFKQYKFVARDIRTISKITQILLLDDDLMARIKLRQMMEEGTVVIVKPGDRCQVTQVLSDNILFVHIPKKSGEWIVLREWLERDDI